MKVPTFNASPSQGYQQQLMGTHSAVRRYAPPQPYRTSQPGITIEQGPLGQVGSLLQGIGSVGQAVGQIGGQIFDITNQYADSKAKIKMQDFKKHMGEYANTLFETNPNYDKYEEEYNEFSREMAETFTGDMGLQERAFFEQYSNQFMAEQKAGILETADGLKRKNIETAWWMQIDEAIQTSNHNDFMGLLNEAPPGIFETQEDLIKFRDEKIHEIDLMDVQRYLDSLGPEMALDAIAKYEQNPEVFGQVKLTDKDLDSLENHYKNMLTIKEDQIKAKETELKRTSRPIYEGLLDKAINPTQWLSLTEIDLNKNTLVPEDSTKLYNIVMAQIRRNEQLAREGTSNQKKDATAEEKKREEDAELTVIDKYNDLINRITDKDDYFDINADILEFQDYWHIRSNGTFKELLDYNRRLNQPADISNVYKAIENMKEALGGDQAVLDALVEAETSIDRLLFDPDTNKLKEDAPRGTALRNLVVDDITSYMDDIAKHAIQIAANQNIGINVVEGSERRKTTPGEALLGMGQLGELSGIERRYPEAVAALTLDHNRAYDSMAGKKNRRELVGNVIPAERVGSEFVDGQVVITDTNKVKWVWELNAELQEEELKQWVKADYSKYIKVVIENGNKIGITADGNYEVLGRAWTTE